MPPSSESLSTLARFPTAAEAHAVRMLLEAEGVRALVVEGDTLRLDPFAADPIPGVRLQVLESDLPAARSILGISGSPEA